MEVILGIVVPFLSTVALTRTFLGMIPAGMVLDEAEARPPKVRAKAGTASPVTESTRVRNGAEQIAESVNATDVSPPRHRRHPVNRGNKQNRKCKTVQ